MLTDETVKTMTHNELCNAIEQLKTELDRRDDLHDKLYKIESTLDVLTEQLQNIDSDYAIEFNNGDGTLVYSSTDTFIHIINTRTDTVVV